MPLDPRSPVIVGVAQLSRHPAPADDLERLNEPAEMMAEVAALAAQDARSDRILSKITSIRVMGLLSWGYLNPGAIVAGKLGLDTKESILTTTGGNSPQMLVNQAGAQITAGELDAALIVGAEAIYTRVLQSRATPPVHGKWIRRDDETAGAPILVGEEIQGNNAAEMAHGMVVPIQVYPIFENALRAASQTGLEEHRNQVARLWSRFSMVAETNPYAWSPRFRTPEEIALPGPDNRMVSYPYTKLMTANIQTDQAAALIVCSVETAQAAGIPRNQWVFLRSGASAHDHWFISNRDNLHSSPAIRLAGRRALEISGAGIDEISHFDVYSCFPSAVQISAMELGISLDDEDRPLTVTGGLGFAGGPGNNYVTHSIAAMATTLRCDPGSLGLVTAVGWYLTKHAIGVYSTEPGVEPFRADNLQAEVDALPSREVVEDPVASPGILESYTVLYDRSGAPDRAIAAVLLPDRRRAWAESTDADLLTHVVTEEVIGRPVMVAEGRVELSSR